MDFEYNSGFGKYHPTVQFLYFLAVIGFSMFMVNSVCLAISFVCSVFYCAMINGAKKTAQNFVWAIPVMIFTILINVAFNHRGATILFYLPGGNPLTLESVFYGISAAATLITVLFWFMCYNKIMTSDKFIYLFGKVIPSLALVISMTLAFIPKFLKQTKKVIQSQKCIGKGIDCTGVAMKIKNGLNIISIMVSWSLENSVDTSDSMHSRGYGTGKRSNFNLYFWTKKDVLLFGAIIIFCSIILYGIFNGIFEINLLFSPPQNLTFYVFYFILFCIPTVIDGADKVKWMNVCRAYDKRNGNR